VEATANAAQTQIKELKASLKQETDRGSEYESQISALKKDLELSKLKDDKASKATQQTESAIAASLSSKEAEVIELKATISDKERLLNKLEAKVAAAKNDSAAAKEQAEQGLVLSPIFLLLKGR